MYIVQSTSMKEILYPTFWKVLVLYLLRLYDEIKRSLRYTLHQHGFLTMQSSVIFKGKVSPQQYFCNIHELQKSVYSDLWRHRLLFRAFLRWIWYFELYYW
jgi:hypothetical protein